MPGGGQQFAFEAQQHLVIGADHVQVDLQRALVKRIVVLREQAFGPRVAIGAALFDRRVTFGELVALDAGQQLGAAPDVKEALAQQRADWPFRAGIDVARRDQIRAQ